VVTEHTQNKAQFGRAGNLGPRNLTASGISHREIGHWVVWITRNIFGINYPAIFSGQSQHMRFLLRLMLGMVRCVSVTTLHAQDDDKPKDAEGCKDSPLITRFPGSIIHSCDNKEFEQADFPMADSQQKHLEGEYQPMLPLFPMRSAKPATSRCMAFTLIPGSLPFCPILKILWAKS
jgi:hypothetical protein